MNAKTKIISLACVALLALTGTASAHHGAGTSKLYAAKLTAPAGTTTAAPTDPATAIRGKALLFDGQSKNVLAVKVRNLKPNTAYTFALDGATDPAPTTATTDENGKLKGFVTSATFNATPGTTYTVVVKEGDTVVASGVLEAVGHKHRGHHRRHAFGKKRHGFVKQARSAQGDQGDSGHSGCNGDKAGAETTKA
jgi:hypothetical protein